MEENQAKRNNEKIYILFFLLFLLSNMVSSFFAIPLLLLILIRIFVSSNEENYYLILFLVPNVRILDCTGNIHLINIVMAVTAILYIVRRRNNITKDTLLALVSLMVLEFSHAFLYSSLSSTLFIDINLWIDYLVCLMIITDEDTEFDFNKSINFLTAGTLMSAAVSLMSNADIVDSLLNVSYYRFSAYGNDPNYYSVYLILSIAGMFWKMQKTGKVIQNIIPILLLSFFGFLTSSKMFVFVLIFMFIVNVFLLIFKRERKSLKTFGGLFVILAIVLITAYSLIKDLFDRFLARFSDTNYSGSLLNRLTSGRSNIQGTYLSRMSNNLLLLLFGAGIRYGTYYKMIVTHNTYLDLFVSYGVVGTFILVMVTLRVILPMIAKGRKFEDYVPLISFAIALFALSCLSADMFYYLLVFTLLPLKWKEQDEMMTE